MDKDSSEGEPRMDYYPKEFQASCFKFGIKDVPSHYTVYRRIKGQDDKLMTRKRLGLEAFKQKSRISGGSYVDVNFPLQTIMIDHTKLDIILLDDITNKYIDRPWFTVALEA